MFQGEGRFIFVPGRRRWVYICLREEKVGVYMFQGGEGSFIYVLGGEGMFIYMCSRRRR